MPIEAVFFGGISHAINYSMRYAQGWRPFAERFGSYSGSIATTSFFADAFLPSLLHQDPRYFRKGRGSIGSRLLNSLKSEIITHTDSGGTAFKTSGVLGFGMPTALSNVWAPRHSVTFDDTMQRLAVKLVVSSALNLFREFGAPEAQDVQSRSFLVRWRGRYCREAGEQVVMALTSNFRTLLGIQRFFVSITGPSPAG